MGVRIIDGRGIACLYDSTTGVAFGPVFNGLDAHDQAMHFADSLPEDARSYSPAMLRGHHATWAEENLDADYGELNSAAARHVLTLL